MKNLSLKKEKRRKNNEWKHNIVEFDASAAGRHPAQQGAMVPAESCSCCERSEQALSSKAKTVHLAS